MSSSAIPCLRADGCISTPESYYETWTDSVCWIARVTELAGALPSAREEGEWLTLYDMPAVIPEQDSAGGRRRCRFSLDEQAAAADES